jgi:ADP-ribose pyrophosphatase YjhB (NUDIX family)
MQSAKRQDRDKDNGKEGVERKKSLSAGAIVFTIVGKEPRALMLLQNNAYYSQKYGRSSNEEVVDIGPKGQVMSGESPIAAASREIREETGLRLHIDTGFEDEESFTMLSKDPKTFKPVQVERRVIYFLAFMHRNDLRRIHLSEEHTRYYLLPLREAIARTRFADRKAILRRAFDYIREAYVT